MSLEDQELCLAEQFCHIACTSNSVLCHFLLQFSFCAILYMLLPTMHITFHICYHVPGYFGSGSSCWDFQLSQLNWHVNSTEPFLIDFFSDESQNCQRSRSDDADPICFTRVTHIDRPARVPVLKQSLLTSPYLCNIDEISFVQKNIILP